jgi:hypothetical protein
VGELARDVLAAEHDPALRGGDEAGERARKRALAGAVGPEYGQHLALADLEVDRAQRAQLAVVDAEPFDAQQRRAVRLGRARAPRRGDVAGAEVHPDHLGVLGDLARSPGSDPAAEVEDDDPLRKRLDERLDVLDEDDRDAPPVHPGDQLRDLVDLVRDEAGGDLVEEQQARLERERPRHLEPLEVEQRQRAGYALGVIGEPAQRQHVVDVAGGRLAARVGGDEQVLPHGHARERARDLVRAADAQACDGVRPKAIDPVLALEDDLAGGRAVEALDEAEQRALAGAVGPDHPEQLVLGDVE